MYIPGDAFDDSKLGIVRLSVSFVSGNRQDSTSPLRSYINEFQTYSPLSETNLGFEQSTRSQDIRLPFTSPSTHPPKSYIRSMILSHLPGVCLYRVIHLLFIQVQIRQETSESVMVSKLTRLQELFLVHSILRVCLQQ